MSCDVPGEFCKCFEHDLTAEEVRRRHKAAREIWERTKVGSPAITIEEFHDDGQRDIS